MIQLEKDGDLWIITLDRPEKANALTVEMLCEIAEIAEAAHDVKALILTGNGKVFSAGADLDAARTGLATDPMWERASAAIAAVNGLTIAAINGTLAGGAFGLALACDIRIASEAAQFFYPVMKLGFLPQPSDPVRMRALIGPARTKMILLAGQKIQAQDALRFGLIDDVIADENIMTAAINLASDALTASHVHINSIKAMI